MNMNLKKAMDGWFLDRGAYVLVDGQYGSTGKGLIAGALAECFWDRMGVSVSNAGPNSGHTSYFDGVKIVLKQLPTFGVIANLIARKLGSRDGCIMYLTAGAIVDLRILTRELKAHGFVAEDNPVRVHPCAAIIDDTMREQDLRNVHDIASTGQGVGPALERKLRRTKSATFGGSIPGMDLSYRTCFFEIPQGYSLGINSGFYPHVTSRECTVSQALADAGMPPSFHRKTIMSLRTFPIRVGDTENSSGPCYPDQHETSWAALGVPAETTTVTGRIRRVFTWSNNQFIDALVANAPDVLFLNFVNYLLAPGYPSIAQFVANMLRLYERAMRRKPDAVLLGFGPKSSDIVVWKGGK